MRRRLHRSLARLLEPGDVLLLAGPLGAGQTEFTQGLAEGLDIKEPVVSPTFTLRSSFSTSTLRNTTLVYTFPAQCRTPDA